MVRRIRHSRSYVRGTLPLVSLPFACVCVCQGDGREIGFCRCRPIRFATYNTLDERLPQPTTVLQKLGRQAFIGFVASVISDTVSNSLRVVKTYRQVNEERVTYCKSLRL